MDSNSHVHALLLSRPFRMSNGANGAPATNGLNILRLQNGGSFPGQGKK